LNFPAFVEAIRMTRQAEEEDECHENTKHDSQGDNDG